MTDAAEFPADGQATEELPHEPRRRQRELSVNLGGISLADVIRESTYWIARLWFRGLFYHRTLRGRRPQVLPLIPEENWPGSSDRGAGLVEGQFRFLNHTVEAAAAFSEENDAGPAWQARLHGFEWLRDMRAVGTEAARVRARQYVTDWADVNQNWHPLIWRPDVMSKRLCCWLTHAEFISAGADEEFAKTFLESIGRQVKHLRRAARFMPEGLERIETTKALIYVSLGLPGGARFMPRLVKNISKICDRQILPDGGHIERSPQAQLAALQNLIDVRSILKISSLDIPDSLQRAIDRAAPMLRFYRHGDGGFALFNGANEGKAWLIDVVLTKAEARGKPLASAVHTGFERIAANRTLLISDTGTPSRTARGTHAGSLSFEISVGKQRMIVNCGAYTGRDETWRLAQRATAAHSTLVAEDRNSTEIRPDGTMGKMVADVWCERVEADGNTWLDVRQDGYTQSLGILHRRRIYLNASGTDVRGEDTLEGEGDHKFAIRFHLHPSVKASLVKDGASVLLRLPDKSGWRMRCSGGVASLQESVYLGDGQEARRTEQIVISGASMQGSAQVKWALSRLTDK
ncbi:MAG: heparinase II/III family protein [Pseudomonadota bacterium]|nr:heparinase II/III family protein [Pseudomonadota bacterium]